MLRTELLEKLSLVEPALAPNDYVIPVLTHLWLQSKSVMAYNDQIAIKVPCQTGIECAVPGSTLLRLLRNSRAKNIEFSLADDECHVKAASSDLKLATIPPSDFIFEMPKQESAPLPVKFTQFLAAIKTCMRSVSADTSVPDQLGITLLPKGDKLHLYSTNNSTISHAIVDLTSKCPLKDRVVLHAKFCEQLLELGKDGSPQLFVDKDHSLLINGKTMLFGTLIEVEKPIDFEAVIAHHLPENLKKKLIEIPTKLELILERAIVITDSATEQTRTQITVKDGEMRFYSKSGKAEVKDKMQVLGHPNVTVKLEPKLIKNGWGAFDKFLVTEDCAIMSKGSNLYLVSANS